MSALEQLHIALPAHFLEPEERDGHLVETNVKELWAIEFDLLHELDRVCRQYNLTYVPIGGTLLGAIRHGGMIPWDDDLDVALLREDYNRLCEIVKREKPFSEPYFFQTEDTDPGSLRGHAQLRNSQTSSFIRGEMGLYRFHQGIFIDIFPLDTMPDDPEEYRSFMEELREAKERANDFANETTRLVPQNSGAVKGLLKRIVRFAATKWHIPKNKPYEAYEKLMQRYNGTDNHEVGIIAVCLLSDRYHWRREWYDDCTPMKFDFMTIPVPTDYEKILARTFGDWHRFVIGTSVHGGLFWDAHTPYTDLLPRLEKERKHNQISL